MDGVGTFAFTFIVFIFAQIFGRESYRVFLKLGGLGGLVARMVAG